MAGLSEDARRAGFKFGKFCMQDDAENALEAVTEPEGELKEPQPSLDEETPTVCTSSQTLLSPQHSSPADS